MNGPAMRRRRCGVSARMPAFPRAFALGLALGGTLASRADAGRLELFLGSGLNFGYAARFRPYWFTENVNYIPHAGVSVTPFRDWKYTGTWTWVEAHSFCVLCTSSRLEEKYTRLTLGAARRILRDTLVEGFLGADFMRQSGRNRYTRVVYGFPDGHSYGGALTDRYFLVGAGASVEVSFARFLSAGTRLGYAWLYERRRTNTLTESIGEDEDARPIAIRSGERGAPLSLEVYMRVSLAPLRW
jgi:hypothetical protein